MDRMPHSRTTKLDGDYTDEEVAFLMAVQAFKQRCRKPRPTDAELLRVAVALG